eukprot:1453581-Amphidinium_carterae.1
MGINLEASRAKMDDQSAAARAQLEVELSRIQEENRRLKAECEQGVRDAQHSEKRVAMSDQDIASAFVKRRLPTKVARPPEFGAPEVASNRSYVSPDGVLHRPKRKKEVRSRQLQTLGRQMSRVVASAGPTVPSWVQNSSLAQPVIITCACSTQIPRVHHHGHCAGAVLELPVALAETRRHQIWRVATNGLPIPGCNHCMRSSPLVSANSSMVAPTHPYPSDGGSPPKSQVHANKGDALWDGSGPPGISAWSKPGGGAPAPEDGGACGSCWPGSSDPEGHNPFRGNHNPLADQDPPDQFGIPSSLRGNTPETIQKSRKEIPKLMVPQNITSTPAATVRQTFEEWVVRATLAVTTWTLTMVARDHFVLVVTEARKNLKLCRAAMAECSPS